MHSTISIKTDNQNRYLYNINSRDFLISHPLIDILLNREKRGEYVNNYIELENILKSHKPTKEVKYSIAEIKYYYNKFNFLKDHGFFSEIYNDSLLQRRIHSHEIENQINNIRNIVFEVTDQCNLKCKYCAYGEFYHNYDERKNKKLNFDTIKTVIDFLYEKWRSCLHQTSRHIVHVGFYGGEPLLNMAVIKKAVGYINSLEDVKRDFVYNITTNAIVLDKHMDYLVENDFHLLISLDGNKQNHSYRVMHNDKNSFDIIYRNLKKLQCDYPDYFSKRVKFNSVLHDRNSIESIHNFIYTEFGKTAQINVISGGGIRKDKREEFYKIFKNMNDDYKHIENLEQLISERFISDMNVFRLALFLRWKSNVVYERYSDLIPKITNKLRYPTGTCFPFSRKMFITVNNKILACERISQEFELGRINENNVQIDFQKIADRYNLYFDILQNQCNFCYDADSCIQCLFHLEDIDKPVPCPNHKTEKTYGNDVSENIKIMEDFPYLYKKIREEVIIK